MDWFASSEPQVPFPRKQEAVLHQCCILLLSNFKCLILITWAWKTLNEMDDVNVFTKTPNWCWPHQGGTLRTENSQDDSTLHQYWEKSNHPNPTLLWKGITHPAPCQLWWVPAGESKLLLRAFTCRIHHFNYIHHIHCFNCYHPQIGNATFTVSNHKLAKNVISTPCEICPGQSRQF